MTLVYCFDLRILTINLIQLRSIFSEEVKGSIVERKNRGINKKRKSQSIWNFRLTIKIFFPETNF